MENMDKWFSIGGEDVDSILAEFDAQVEPWVVDPARVVRKVGAKKNGADQADVAHGRAKAVGDPVKYDFAVVPARSLKGIYAEFCVGSDKLAGLKWPAEGRIVIDAAMTEAVLASGKRVRRLTRWSVRGTRGRGTKVLRAEDLPVVESNGAE